MDAEKRFLDKLKGVEDPQRKRQIIGAEFGYVFLDEAVKFGITKEDFFAQGTIYPDVIESARGMPTSSRATTTSSCPERSLSSSRPFWSRWIIFSRTKFGCWAKNWGFLIILSTVSPSRAPALPFVSSAT